MVEGLAILLGRVVELRIAIRERAFQQTGDTGLPQLIGERRQVAKVGLESLVFVGIPESRGRLTFLVMSLPDLTERGMASRLGSGRAHHAAEAGSERGDVRGLAVFLEEVESREPVHEAMRSRSSQPELLAELRGLHRI